MKIITMYNNKGGVGKTTSVINIAYSLHLIGKKVLVMDFDEQRNCSRFFIDPISDSLTKIDRTPDTTRYNNIEIYSYEKSIKCCEVFLNDGNTADLDKFRQRLLKMSYDYIIFDLPPALNILTFSMLKLCDYVFIPIELGTFAIQGISVVVDKLSAISAKFGGCFVVKFDNENPSDYSLLDILKDALGTKVLKTIIPFSRVIKNSISYRMTAAEYMNYMVAAEKYGELTNEIVGICRE